MNLQQYYRAALSSTSFHDAMRLLAQQAYPKVYPLGQAEALRRRWCAIAICLGLSALAIKPQSALGAERVKLIYGPFNGKISVASLEKYAATGEMDREFRLYSKFVDQEKLIKLRYWLNNRFESDRVEMYEFTNAPAGEKFLQELGTVIKTHPQGNGFYALRSALIGAADLPHDSDGWTVIEAMQNFPTEDLEINTKELFKLQKFWSDNHNHQAALEMFNPRK